MDLDKIAQELLENGMACGHTDDLIAEVRRLRTNYQSVTGQRDNVMEIKNRYLSEKRDLEAQAAAMRAALENIKMRLSAEEKSKGEVPRIQTHAEIDAALSGDAGKDYVHKDLIVATQVASDIWHKARAEGAAEIKERIDAQLARVTGLVEELRGLK